MPETPPADVVKWYTSARHIPQLIGRTPDGTKIPFGPFNTWALGVGAAVFISCYQLLELGMDSSKLVWGSVIVLAIGSGYLVDKVQMGGRNPLTAIAGGITALTSPQYGHVAGRRVTIRRPHVVRGRTLIAVEMADANAPIEPAPAAPSVVKPVPPAAEQAIREQPADQPSRAITSLSGVQKLLASLPESQK